MARTLSETKRLERLWTGNFGDAYTSRNSDAYSNRRPFWKSLLQRVELRNCLEVGCNVGGNLRWIAEFIPPESTFGVDINRGAIEKLHRQFPRINALYSPARQLPFRDRHFDLVFTMGVLIHLPAESLPVVMSEIYRCSNRYILCGEYYASQPTAVPYRGQDGALFKRDFGALYRQFFPELKLRKKGFLARKTGWDDITYWFFEKP